MHEKSKFERPQSLDVAVENLRTIDSLLVTAIDNKMAWDLIEDNSTTITRNSVQILDTKHVWVNALTDLHQKRRELVKGPITDLLAEMGWISLLETTELVLSSSQQELIAV